MVRLPKVLFHAGEDRYPHSEPADPSFSGPDPTSTPMLMDGDWKRSLQAFIARMSKVHDPGRFPLAITIRHILGQVYDAHSGEFAASAEGVRSAVRYDAFTRPED